MIAMELLPLIPRISIGLVLPRDETLGLPDVVCKKSPDPACAPSNDSWYFPYTYSDEYKIENSLEFIGSQSTNMETLQINNQGGLIGFSIASDNLGEYIFSENEKLPSDGKLLAKAGVKDEEMKFKISFDLIIETESNHKFKANISLNLPTGNILKDGVGTLEDTELKNIVFKRF